MPDREKVIKGLECCQLVYECEPYKNCPYSNRFACGDCNINQLHYDALALLKEQEDKPVLDEFGKCFLNALKRQLDMKLTMIELLITPEFAEKIVELIEKMFD